MRRIERTARFKKDFKRKMKGQNKAALQTIFVEVVTALIKDEPLAPARYDHALSGDWADQRDCHIKPDLILIYRKPDDEVLQLVRIGSHSELGW